MGKVQIRQSGIERFLHGEKGSAFSSISPTPSARCHRHLGRAVQNSAPARRPAMLLSIGMGTEIAMFILTAFDRPPKEYAWEDVFPSTRKNPEDRPDFTGGGGVVISAGHGAPAGEDTGALAEYNATAGTPGEVPPGHSSPASRGNSRL